MRYPLTILIRHGVVDIDIEIIARVTQYIIFRLELLYLWSWRWSSKNNDHGFGGFSISTSDQIVEDGDVYIFQHIPYIKSTGLFKLIKSTGLLDYWISLPRGSPPAPPLLCGCSPLVGV